MAKVILVFIVFLLQHPQVYDWQQLSDYNQAFDIQMFQNSFLSRVSVKCSQHPKSNITHICVDPRCDSSPLFCQECMSQFKFKEKHYSHELNVMDIFTGLEQLSRRIQKDKRPIGNIYRQIITLKSTEGLLKWQGQKQQHFLSIQKHLNTLKFQIEEEIQNILKKFSDQLQVEKASVYNELEQYYKNYRQKFDRFSRMTQPIVSMNNQFKFYASKNAMVFKVSSQLDQSKLKNWLVDLKKTLFLTEKAVRDPEEFTLQIKQHGQAANEIIDDLPRIRNVDYQVELPGILNSSVKQVLRSLVKLRQTRMTTVCRSISMNSIPSETHKWRSGANM